MSHPFHDVAIVGAFNTAQARLLPDEDSWTITLDAALGALTDAGISPLEVDGVVSPHSGAFIYETRIGPAWRAQSIGIPAVLEAASAIATGRATVVVIADGTAGTYVDRDATAPWTRPENEFVAAYGMFTAAEFALIARRHMYMYGTPVESLARVASVIRNNGHLNPEAVYFGRGPYTPEDILASRMVADPYHLLDCATTSEGGCGLVLVHSERLSDIEKPVFILGGNTDRYGESYCRPPTFELGGRKRADFINGWAGRRAAEACWSSSGLRPADVDVCEFYDPFSFEIIRQFEAFGFCPEGEGGLFVMEDRIEVGGECPITTDGGTMSFGHSGSAQMLQRVSRAVQQLRGECRTRQVPNAQVAMCSGSGAGACSTDVLLLGNERP